MANHTPGPILSVTLGDLRNALAQGAWDFLAWGCIAFLRDPSHCHSHRVCAWDLLRFARQKRALTLGK